MKFSVLIPVLNGGKTINQAIDSVLSQTYQDYEICIHDGKSADDTVAIIDTYVNKHKEKVKLSVGIDSGSSEAINKAFSLSTGEFFIILSADDFFKSNNILQQVADELKKKSDVDIVATNIEIIKQHDDTHIQIGTPDPSKLLWGVRLFLPGSFFRSTLMKTRGFDPNVKVANDYDTICFWYYTLKAKVVHLPIVSVCFRTGGMSSQFKNIFTIEKEMFNTRLQYFGFTKAALLYFINLLNLILHYYEFRPFYWFRKLKKCF